MISNHHSFAYSHDLAWVIMSLFIFAGALIRQFFVLIHSGNIKPAYPVAGVVLIALAFWIGSPASSSALNRDSADDGPGLEEVHAIVVTRCVACHASQPTQPGFSAPPAGVVYENPEQVVRQRARIQQVVASGYMPLGNMTGMTDEERAVIAAWGE
ncbi:urate hydroxylase PuuD [Halomonas sp.]|uniref:urate hydroxylase PuuD n=1 Tax=Halomonas sp. TaxID=1486246 RepID=UPI003561FEFF